VLKFSVRNTLYILGLKNDKNAYLGGLNNAKFKTSTTIIYKKSLFVEPKIQVVISL
jgi:hypothetical protein